MNVYASVAAQARITRRTGSVSCTGRSPPEHRACRHGRRAACTGLLLRCAACSRLAAICEPLPLCCSVLATPRASRSMHGANPWHTVSLLRSNFLFSTFTMSRGRIDRHRQMKCCRQRRHGYGAGVARARSAEFDAEYSPVPAFTRRSWARRSSSTVALSGERTRKGPACEPRGCSHPACARPSGRTRHRQLSAVVRSCIAYGRIEVRSGRQASQSQAQQMSREPPLYTGSSPVHHI
jgi:hypothetical protein